MNRENTQRDIDTLLESFEPDPASPHPPAVQKAVHLARLLQQRAARLQTPQEKKQQAELERMMQTPGDKATLVQITDQAFRSSNPYRAADQLVHILDVQGVPRFFAPLKRTLLKGFQSFGAHLPGVAIPLVKEKMRGETANVILPAERELLAEHLENRRQEGMRMNVNYLGEALLGEDQARARLKAYLEAIQLPEIEVLSVKISTIYSQISSLAREQTVRVLCDRLERLLRDAARSRFVHADGRETPKFIYLDMEEYRDTVITADAFMQTLDRKGLERVEAGIALQAYIPDAILTQIAINDWARKRVQAGGAPVTIRLVKGANLEMERVEASLRGWPQAPFKNKLDTDANFKRMLHEGMKPENIRAVRLGIASHNLFDLAYSLVLAEEGGVLDRVQFEMLEGMANHQRRALFELNRSMLLYAPATYQKDFIYAIGYLVRRLDENTGPENFLRHTFKLEVDSDDWKQLETGFLNSFELIEELPESSRRTQDRRKPAEDPPAGAPFANEPDTDFSLPQNAKWAEEIIRRWIDRHGERAPDIPLVVGGEELFEDREVQQCLDPSRPGVVIGRCRQANERDVEEAVRYAREDPPGWRTMTPAQRSEILYRVAGEIRSRRADLLGAAMADGAKLFTESDPEVSEAVDFVEFYRREAARFHEVPGITARAKGVVVVVPPWNFPVAIPCGGVAAALAAGNTVILKPSPLSVLTAYHLCDCFWSAGVSKQTLQFLPCPSIDLASQLVSHEGVDAVILTGGTRTAFNMLRTKPTLDLAAETGGKNATIVTAMSDRDQAIKHVIQSAFGHSGQKCSATSLLILEKEVYEDAEFKRALIDAARSLKVGSAWELDTRVGPLIRPPLVDLENALKGLEEGESWALMPECDPDNPQLWSPGVKWGVQPGSYTHMTEFFGPVLGVMKADNLDEAIAYVNQTGYGLTSGLQSLDYREQESWTERIRAGNLYLNRGTTGAVVRRQPFGGMGLSAFGPGIKAGGPNYVAQFMQFEQSGTPEYEKAELDPHLERLEKSLSTLDGFPVGEIRRVLKALHSYAYHHEMEFGWLDEPVRLVGEDNFRRYLAVEELRIRIDPRDGFFDIFARVCAARTARCRITVSTPPGYQPPVLQRLYTLTECWAGSIELVEESDQELAEIIRNGSTDRVRYAAPNRVPEVVYRAAAEAGQYIAAAPVLAEGRIELLWYLREQTVTRQYHRYGNLLDRAEEERAEVL